MKFQVYNALSAVEKAKRLKGENAYVSFVHTTTQVSKRQKSDT